MRHFSYLYLIPVAVRIVVALSNGRGGSNGIGSGDVKGHSFGGSNHNGAADAHNDVPPGTGSSSNNGFGGSNGHGAVGYHGQEQSNAHGLAGVDAIVNAINSAGQQVHTVNHAIRNMRTGGTIEHLDSTLQSLSSMIRATSTTISAAGPLEAGDVDSLKLAIQPLQQSIGTLVTQLVGRRETIARLCGCRRVQHAFNHMRSSTRVMFDGIKNRFNRGAAHHGRHALNSFDSGIASFLNHGYNAFGVSNCVDVGGISHTTTQTSTWTSSSLTAFTTVVITNTVTKTVISTSWISDVYSTYTSEYTSTYTSQETDVPSDSSGFGLGENTYGHQYADD
ncbi:hypothetical protein F5Y13DRAFT_189023 [Hypoxylon sp. FL1857]|nr:hypothetical protein F5Y13DRAFT_189023 [Hypoxylon sp. FL1857]